MKQAINTRTQEEYDALMRYYESKGIEWGAFGQATNCPEFWEEGRELTCVTTEHREGVIEYAHIDFFVEKGYTIIPYTEFAKANIEPDIDYKAKYEEAVGFLERAMIFIPQRGQDIDSLNQIKAFLTKHNDLTNHKDGE